MENEELYNSLVKLLKMFKNKPYHLAKYFIDNNALNDDFIKKIQNSEHLKNNNLNNENTSVYFLDLAEMKEYYQSILDSIDNPKEKSIEDITIEFNNKLNKLIKEELYEDASRIRDFMIKNNIKINN